MTTERNVASFRPPEVLCQIFRFAVERDGVKALLPLTQVNTQWRHTALGDSSLWTIIRLEHTTPPLLDMIFAHAGNRLFTVYVSRCEIGRFEKLWKLAERIGELHCLVDPRELAPFLSSLGPAPNLNTLHVQPDPIIDIGAFGPLIHLPVIFSGSLPSLRHLTLKFAVTWPPGFFKHLTSFECGLTDQHRISPPHVFDVLRESPSIEFIRLIGRCFISPRFNPPTIHLNSLRTCILIGLGTVSLLRFISIPASAQVFLTSPYVNNGAAFGGFSAEPGLQVIDEVATFSFFISDLSIKLRAENSHGGVMQVEVVKLHNLSRDPLMFAHLSRSCFECGRTFPGSKTAKRIMLDVERQRGLGPEEANYFALDLVVCILGLPDVEEVTLRGLPLQELLTTLEFLCGSSGSRIPCQNLKKLHIESSPISSPLPLLVKLNKVLTDRKSAGVTLHSISVRAKCDASIPISNHGGFLDSWKRLVEGDVRIECEEVKTLPMSRHRIWGEL